MQVKSNKVFEIKSIDLPPNNEKGSRLKITKIVLPILAAAGVITTGVLFGVPAALITATVIAGSFVTCLAIRRIYNIKKEISAEAKKTKLEKIQELQKNIKPVLSNDAGATQISKTNDAIKRQITILVGNDQQFAEEGNIRLDALDQKQRHDPTIVEKAIKQDPENIFLAPSTFYSIDAFWEGKEEAFMLAFNPFNYDHRPVFSSSEYIMKYPSRFLITTSALIRQKKIDINSGLEKFYHFLSLRFSSYTTWRRIVRPKIDEEEVKRLETIISVFTNVFFEDHNPDQKTLNAIALTAARIFEVYTACNLEKENQLKPYFKPIVEFIIDKTKFEDESDESEFVQHFIGLVLS